MTIAEVLAHQTPALEPWEKLELVLDHVLAPSIPANWFYLMQYNEMY